MRHDLVSHFFSATDEWLTVGDTGVRLCEESDDAFDAVIAALVARAATVGLTEPIPDELGPAALREGWTPCHFPILCTCWPRRMAAFAVEMA